MAQVVERREASTSDAVVLVAMVPPISVHDNRVRIEWEMSTFLAPLGNSEIQQGVPEAGLRKFPTPKRAQHESPSDS